MANPFKDFTIRLHEGDNVYQEGEAGMMMYVIQAGAVELYREVDGQRVSYGVLEKGDFFGEMSLLLERQPRTTSAAVVEDATLVEIDSTLFDKMIRGNIEIAVRMMRKLSLRLREREMEAEQGAAAQAQAVEHAGAAAAGEAAGPQAPVEPAPIEVVAVPPPSPVAAAPAPPVQASPPAPAAVPVAAGPARNSPRQAQPPAGPVTTLAQLQQQTPDAHAVLATLDGNLHFPFVGDEAAIGRFDPVTGMRPEVDVSPIDINRSVSRHHARITRGGSSYTLTEEVGALNGTFVNEKALVTGEPTSLQDGDELGVGVVRLRFHVFGASS